MLYLSSLAVVTLQRVDLRDANFCCFFQKPLEAIDIFCGCHTHGQTIAHALIFGPCLHHLNFAAFHIVTDHFTAIHITFSIGQMKLIADGHSEHSNTVF